MSYQKTSLDITMMADFASQGSHRAALVRADPTRGTGLVYMDISVGGHWRITDGLVVSLLSTLSLSRSGPRMMGSTLILFCCVVHDKVILLCSVG